MSSWINRFNPRSRVRSDMIYGTPSHDLAGFNPRSRVRSDIRPRWACFHRAKFQSTLPREERHMKFTGNVMYASFQSTLPREERRDGIRFPP